ncbi:hypothetical protein AWW66_03250 [Micromonospora rosaria]|uniref:Uncharacterized protein n=1 Tax=Micromonospora rosaria TaxID=47874 RepID=A0A136PYA4_9ACTN|nr:hypothetical protein [Micromonospora rosaria]KXK63343.1 hypothetical protein AWW66_03250 [Micromonospora rosaria]
MLDAAIADLAAKAGPAGLLCLVVVLILLGRLLPRSAHEDRVGDLKERISSLEATLATRDAELRVRGEQVSRLLGQGDMSVQVLESLAREAGADDAVVE